MNSVHEEKGYITLKEAAEISSYSPDYIGQLIRQGKLPGKQVYHNVAWVTTEDAVRAYMKGGAKSVNTDSSPKEWLEAHLPEIFKTLLYIGIGVLMVVGIFLFYVAAVSIDDTLDRRALENKQTLPTLEEIDARQRQAQ